MAHSAQHLASKNKYQSIQGRSCWHLNMSNFYYNRGRHCPIFVGDPPHPSVTFPCATKLDIHPTSVFEKTLCCNPTTLMAYHKNNGRMSYSWSLDSLPFYLHALKWKLTLSPKRISLITIGDIPHCTRLDFTKMSSPALGKKGKWVYFKYLHCVFNFMCKVDYKSIKYIHVPMYIYNKVM